jgi:hypothetical protein
MRMWQWHAIIACSDMPAACMQATLHARYHVGAALGAAAVAFRQTNAVWVAFILGVAIVSRALERNPQARRLPAERQLLHVLRSSWQVRALTMDETKSHPIGSCSRQHACIEVLGIVCSPF